MEGPNGWQTLSVAGEGANPGETNRLDLADAAREYLAAEAPTIAAVPVFAAAN